MSSRRVARSAFALLLGAALAGWPAASALAVSPAAPTVSSPSHQMAVWSNDNTPALSWSAGAADVDGWSYEWSAYSGGGAPEQFRLDGSATGMTADPLADGFWYFYLRYHDRTGGWSASAQLGPFDIDTAAPNPGSLTSDIDHPPGGTSTDGTIGITWSAAYDPYTVSPDYVSGAAGVSWEWSASASPIVPDTVVDGGPGQGGTQSEPLADGTWYFYIRAVDNAGNWGTASRIGPFVIAAGPMVHIDSGPAEQSTNNPATVTFKFSSNSANATFKCAFDGASFTACSSPKTYSNLTNGWHEFQVRAVSAAGTQGSPQYRSFWVGPPPIIAPPWDAVQDIATAGQPIGPSVAYDPAGKLHIAYLVWTGASKGLYYATNKSGTWQKTLIGSATGNEVWTSIAVDSTGAVHIAYEKFGSAIYYLTNATGAWVTQKVNSAPALVDFPEIAVDSQRKVHIVYFLPGSSAGLRYSTNASGSWVTKRITKNSFDIYADIAVDAARKVHVLYGRERKAYRYATNKSGTWVHSSVMTFTGFARQPSIDLNSQGMPVVAMSVSTTDPLTQGLWLAHKGSAGWTRVRLEYTQTLSNQLAISLNGTEHVVAYGGGIHFSNETGAWGSENVGAPGVISGKVAFDISALGELVVVGYTVDGYLHVATRPPAS